METSQQHARWLTLEQAASLAFPDKPISLARKALFQAIDNGEIALHVQLQSQQLIAADTDDDEFVTVSDTLTVHLSNNPHCDQLRGWLRDGAKGLASSANGVAIPQVIYQGKIFDLVDYDPRDESILAEPPAIKTTDLVVLESSLQPKTGHKNQGKAEPDKTTYTVKVQEKPDDDELIDVKAVTKMLGISESTWYAKVKEREFPEPIKFGKASRWKKGDIRKIVAERSPGFRYRIKKPPEQSGKE